MNGYEFCPEDGSTLYEEEAWELSEQARSLWLRLTFAGEYSEGMSPVQIQGRKYLPMFTARDGVYTIEQVREKILAGFSEEFTDKTLNAAIASKDLLEYNGNKEIKGGNLLSIKSLLIIKIVKIFKKPII